MTAPATAEPVASEYPWLVFTADAAMGSELVNAFAMAGVPAEAAPLDKLEAVLAEHANGNVPPGGIVVLAGDDADARVPSLEGRAGAASGRLVARATAMVCHPRRTGGGRFGLASSFSEPGGIVGSWPDRRGGAPEPLGWTGRP